MLDRPTPPIRSRREPTIMEIMEETAKAFRVPVGALRSNSRYRFDTRPRQVSAYLARVLTTKSFVQIGLRLNRDHTTIIHATRKVAELMLSDPAFAQKVAEIQRSIEHRLEATGIPAQTPWAKAG